MNFKRTLFEQTTYPELNKHRMWIKLQKKVKKSKHHFKGREPTTKIAIFSLGWNGIRKMIFFGMLRFESKRKKQFIFTPWTWYGLSLSLVCLSFYFRFSTYSLDCVGLSVFISIKNGLWLSFCFSLFFSCVFFLFLFFNISLELCLSFCLSFSYIH